MLPRPFLGLERRRVLSRPVSENVGIHDRVAERPGPELFVCTRERFHAMARGEAGHLEKQP